MTDSTYIRTWRGWLYLGVGLDLYSRRVVRDEADRREEALLDALLMAVGRRKPTQKVLVHSDQGSRYGSDDWRRSCMSNQLEPSTSRCGNCWDNPVSEAFFSSLEKERIR